MPELPEVETIRRNLDKRLRQGRVEDVSAPTHPRTLRYQTGGFAKFKELLQGHRLEYFARRGKFLWIGLDGGDNSALCFHLGMSGQLRLLPAQNAVLPHERIRFTLSLGGVPLGLVFCDQRTFGHVELRALKPTSDGFAGGSGTNLALLPVGLEHIARDVLDPHLETDLVLGKLRTSRRAIKSKLLDQGIISGIGNIYADEGLFAARIHPATAANNLDDKAGLRLLEAVAGVMRRALKFGGTSFDRLYVNSWGHPGDFAKELQVYGRGGKPCRHCGGTLDKMVIDGRSTVFCSHCAPLVVVPGK